MRTRAIVRVDYPHRLGRYGSENRSESTCGRTAPSSPRLGPCFEATPAWLPTAVAAPATLPRREAAKKSPYFILRGNSSEAQASGHFFTASRDFADDWRTAPTRVMVK